jgi:2-(1,2-epoxy-1,2-dihydrophenyl)acetyl-CoA isomerase
MSAPEFRTLVLEEFPGGVLKVRLNRPERLNAIDDVMRDELAALLRSLPSRIQAGEVRVLLITGTGRAFCSGGDVKEFPRIFGQADEVERQMLAYQELPRLLVHLEIPVIAAVNGLAVGGGFVLACACDLRVASETSRFALSFVERGLGLDLGGSYFLLRLIGLGRALRLALTGEPVDARQAEAIGLVNWVVPDAELEGHALRVAQGLAARSPVALRSIKGALYRSAGDLDAALGLEAGAQAAALAAMEGNTRPIR